MRAEAEREGLELEIDSAGTGSWHIGDGPDPRACTEAKGRGVDITHYRARQVCVADFDHFDHIIAMDSSNLTHLKSMVPAKSRAQLSLLLDHVPGQEGQDVADPYFGKSEGFAVTWDQVSKAARTLVFRLRETK